ncbi:hypothetical protein AMECASPLE_033967 [Ameca splendens]|uniref:Uncharacterized protein n=1 Tax=Ameca splendens TaxID=208324 RepID=A0ABV0ZT46_9TELE
MSLNDSFKLFFLQGGQIEQKHKFNLFLKNKNWANKFEFTVLLLKSRRSKLYTQAHIYAYGWVFDHFCPYGQAKGLMVARRIFEEVKVRLLNSNHNLMTQAWWWQDHGEVLFYWQWDRCTGQSG